MTAFFKFYKMCTLLYHSKLNILAKNRFDNSAIFVKFQFPKTPRRGANERAVSAASCAAGGANSENSNKLGSENVNAARI